MIKNMHDEIVQLRKQTQLLLHVRRQAMNVTNIIQMLEAREILRAEEGQPGDEAKKNQIKRQKDKLLEIERAVGKLHNTMKEARLGLCHSWDQEDEEWA